MSRPYSTAPISVCDVTVNYGGPDVLASVSLDVAAGSTVSLLGPSGCGKTTLLRSIAGLERISSGTISIGDQIVSSQRVHVPAEKRRTGMVFQDWALFPHMTVQDNVAYGLARADRSGDRVANVLDMVGLGALGERKPQTLSGGQQQRVALARALAPHPQVLLLDEPFSNLDTALRVEIRAEVHRLLHELEVTAVFVTHDQDEAFVLGDQVAVMSAGQIVQAGSPAELYVRPVTPWVAKFVGEANLIRSVAHRGIATTSVGAVPLSNDCEGVVDVLIRPEEIDLQPNDAGPGTVVVIEYYGHDSTYEIDMGDHSIRVRLGSVPRFRRGDRVTPLFVGDEAAAFGSPDEA